MGCTQSLLPLCAAMISFSRQIGLLGAFQGVAGTGLGDQLYQILASSWASTGPLAASASRPASVKLRSFMRRFSQTHVLAGETMSSLPAQYNRPGSKIRCKSLPPGAGKL